MLLLDLIVDNDGLNYRTYVLLRQASDMGGPGASKQNMGARESEKSACIKNGMRKIPSRSSFDFGLIRI